VNADIISPVVGVAEVFKTKVVSYPTAFGFIVGYFGLVGTSVDDAEDEKLIFII
jgi:hypothetical protein